MWPWRRAPIPKRKPQFWVREREKEEEVVMDEKERRSRRWRRIWKRKRIWRRRKGKRRRRIWRKRRESRGVGGRRVGGEGGGDLPKVPC